MGVGERERDERQRGSNGSKMGVTSGQHDGESESESEGDETEGLQNVSEMAPKWE